MCKREACEMGTNWVEKAGGLPEMVKRMAKHLKEKNPGWTESHCIAVAVNAVKKMAKTGDTNFKGKQNVGAKARGRASRNAAEWERKKASTHLSQDAQEAAETWAIIELAQSGGSDTRGDVIAKNPSKKKKETDKGPQEPDRLPPGAVGWKHGWVPVDANGNPVKDAQKEADAQKADTEKVLKEGKAKHGAALKKQADEKAAREAETAKNKAEAAKRKTAAEAKRKANEAKRAVREKESARKKSVADIKRKSAESRAKLKEAAAQAIKDRKEGRQLTPYQVQALAAWEQLQRADVYYKRTGGVDR